MKLYPTLAWGFFFFLFFFLLGNGKQYLKLSEQSLYAISLDPEALAIYVLGY